MPLHPFAENPLRSRADVERAVGELFDPLIPFFSASGARVQLSATAAHFDQAAAELEGFARPLWGIVPMAAGGGLFKHWPIYRRGLANGTDPNHPDYWGDISDTDQRQVELAAIGFALCLVPEHIWEPLDEAAKANVANYLTSARERHFVNSNWKFFRILIDLGLMRCGVQVEAVKHEQYLDDIEEFVMQNGWYRDGPIRSADHYIPFAFHYYGLIYSVLAGDEVRGEKYRQRAEQFAQSIKHWYAPDGSALPFGRSLTYRFAHAGFWGALAYAGVEALPWGQIKGYYLRNLRWWAKQPMFERDGVLSIGYCYPNLMLSEGYNSAGSPYWAMKAFLPLALPQDHPFWTAKEEVPEIGETTQALPEPGMVIQHLPGHIVALTNGQKYDRWRGTPEKYGKFAYSTRYGFSIEANERYLPSAACDNALFLSEDGRHFRMRESCEEAIIADTILYSKWRAYEDIEVETWLVPYKKWHFRFHEIKSPRQLEIAEGGFAVAKPDFQNWQETVAGKRAEALTASDYSVIIGFDARHAQLLSPLSNTNVMAARTLLPQLRGSIPVGTTQLKCAVSAGPADSQTGNTVGDIHWDIEKLRQYIKDFGRPIPIHDLENRSSH